MKKHYITKIILWIAAIILTLTAISHATPAINIKAGAYGMSSSDYPLMTAFNVYQGTYYITTYSSSGTPTYCAVYQVTQERGMELVGITESNDFTLTVRQSATDIISCWPQWGEDTVFIGVK